LKDFKAATICINLKKDNHLHHSWLAEIFTCFDLIFFSSVSYFVIYWCPSVCQQGGCGNRMFWSGKFWSLFNKSIWILWSQFKYLKEKNPPVLLFCAWTIDFVIFSTKVDFSNYNISVVTPLQTKSLRHVIERYLSLGCFESICKEKLCI